MEDILIIGGGFAGVATAFHLGASFGGKVLVVEKEDMPGFHASGRNASLLLQSVGDPTIRKIVSDSRMAYADLGDRVGYQPVGSLQLGAPEALEKLRDKELVPSEILSPEQAKEKVPVLKGHRFPAALFTPSDGVIDISKLLQFYLDGARESGIEIKVNCEVTSIEHVNGTYRVQTSKGLVEAKAVVNAAGAWAPEVARMAGIDPLPMKAFKRHLFVIEGIEGVDPSWPFAWSIEKNFYFRPESGGVLFSVCDEEFCKEGFVQTVDPEISEVLAAVIAEELPCFEEALQRRVWSCFRTKTPDGQFHLGWSAVNKGWFWVAGLGGHGMGASWEVGRRAAEDLRENWPF